MKYYVPLFSLILVIQLLSTGCATVIKGSNQKIPVNSEPPDADVIADGSLAGQTPLVLNLSRKNDHLVTIQKEGYKSKSIPLVKHVGGAVWGNILAGGLIGWGVDATSGAQYNLSPESISVELAQSTGEDDTQDVALKHEFVSRLNDIDKLKEDDRISDEEYLKMRTEIFKQYFPGMVQSGGEASE